MLSEEVNSPAFEDAVLKKMGEYLQEYDSAFVHKQSFDFFINHRLSKIIEEEPTIVVPIGDNRFYNIHFGQIFVDKPYIIDENRQIRYIVPNEARLRDLSYNSLVSINIRTFITEKKADGTIKESEVQEFFKVNLARIPMMIGTSKCNLYNKSREQKNELGECAYDNGGYFIIKGKERVLVSQERINYNIVHVFEQKSNSKFTMGAEIRSMSEETGHSVLIQMKMTNSIEKRVVLQIPYVSQEIPLGYIFRAFNFSLSEIQYILDFNLGKAYSKYPVLQVFMRNIIREAQNINSQDKAVAFISQFSMHSLSKERKFYYINQILNNELFPHLGITSSRNQKGFFLGHMLSKLLFTFVKKRSMDDRDHINNKRLEAGGHLLSELFRTLFKRFVRSMEPQLAKRPDILVVMSRNNLITQGIKHCFSTGNWGIPKSNYIRTGVSQILSRLTYNSFLSHLRRILIPIGKEGKNTKIRQLHPSQIGYICPYETPEGHCLTGDTMILTGDGVTSVPITHFKEEKETVLSVDPESGEEVKTGIYQYFEVQPEKLFKFTILPERSIRASGLHPFLVLTEEGDIQWKKSEDIVKSDRMATRKMLRSVPSQSTEARASTHFRVLGLLRVLYQEDKKEVTIPPFLNWSKVLSDLKDVFSERVFKVREKTREIGIRGIKNLIHTDSILPELIIKTKDQSLRRDYLMGFFCGLMQEPDCLFDVELILSSTSLYFNGTPSQWISSLKSFLQTMSLHFGISWDCVSYPPGEEEKSNIYLRNSRSNIVDFIDFFGFYYEDVRQRELFLFSDFLSWSENHSSSLPDYINQVRLYHDNIIFYPITNIQRVAVETTMDFTTRHDNHSFIANGFVTHNSAGIVKNMTLTTHLSTKASTVFIRMVLEEIEEIEMNFDFGDSGGLTPSLGKKDYYKILLDGNWVGSCTSIDVYHKILKYKDNSRFSPMISVSMNPNEREILIFADEGRMIRPLFNVKNFPTLEELQNKTAHQLIKEKKIVLMDSYEMENHIVAMKPHEILEKDYYTLCEIHPSLIVGLCVGLIPYSDHTQAPRITYHASMGKQAIGVYSTTNNTRADTIVHVLHYPERPLVQTHIGKVTGCDAMVFGVNLIVAVAMYSGFNQEDSVILNQSAIDRGMFRSFGFRTVHVEERKKSTTHTEDILLPPKDIRAKSYNYSKLDESGIVQCGLYVGPSDVIVGRVQTKNIKSGGEEKADTSVVLKSGEEGYIDRVFISSSPEGYKMVKVKIRTLKIPEIGDKVASRAAQKGTVGMVFRQEDMPFSMESGIVPDIIINPLCLPSRMTINQIIECIASKNSALEGRFRFGTPFTRHSTDVVEDLCQSLRKNGYNENGKETMCSGISGEMFKAQIFMGPTYYHRLKHLVSAKIHARNHGSLQALTRQPVEGRSRDGGLRFGEMERDTVWGASSISLSCGLSVKLEKMEGKIWEVLGWSKELDGIIPRKQIEFLDKGEKDCVEITLEDGRKIRCTPDHPMLTTEKEWVRAKDLVIGQTKLKVGVTYPLMEVEEEIKECKGWSLKVGGYNLTTDNITSYLDTLAFMRILGWLITDGGVYARGNQFYGTITLGHLLDVENFMKDLSRFCETTQENFERSSCDQKYQYYLVRLPKEFVMNVLEIKGLTVGRKVNQPATFPEFVLDPEFPQPLLREFLGGMFGGDGHTCHLGMHRGKRDLLTSVSFSWSKTKPFLDSLTCWMEDLSKLLKRFGFEKVTIQKFKEISHSKQNKLKEEEKSYQLTLHIDLSELILFSEKIGFRHCCHKSQRLEVGVSYKRLRNEVTRQHNWIVKRVDELTKFSEIKKENPNKKVPTLKAIRDAVEELKKQEPLLHDYAIPSTHDITDHLIKGTQFGKFTSKSFPNAEEFITMIGALDWFLETDEEKRVGGHTCYGVSRDLMCLPTMNLKVLGVIPCGKERVCDIEVEETNSFLANGIVAHNCMISHGVSRFLTERLFDMSDVFSVPVCAECGTMPHSLEICNRCESNNVRMVLIPYACKLLFQELMALGIKINIFPDEDKRFKVLTSS